MSQVEIYSKGRGGVAFVALVVLVAACGANSPDVVVVSEGMVAASDVQGATNVFVR